MSGQRNLTNAQCTLGTSETRTFETYLRSCRTIQDNTRANNFFSPSTVDFNNSFENLRAQFDNLLHSGNSISVMADMAGATGDQANRQLDTLQKRRDMLAAEIKSMRSKVEGSDRQFLDDIMNGTPKKELAPSLQDGALLLFWFSWMIMVVTIVGVRWGSPSGGWKPGLFTLLLMILVTICVYAILGMVA
jgi:hypothetical protein